MTAATVRRGAATPKDVESLLAALPEWFSIEEENRRYVAAAERQANHAALIDGAVVGVALTRRHSPHAAELTLLAVHPDVHRQGVGRALVTAVEGDLAADGVELLQVKTLGASDPSPEYAATRTFYRALGYRDLEELHDLWPDQPCLILVKVLHASAG